jgi:integrase
LPNSIRLANGIYVYRQQYPTDVLKLHPKLPKVVKKSTSTTVASEAMALIESWTKEFERRVEGLRKGFVTGDLKLEKQAKEIIKVYATKPSYKSDHGPESDVTTQLDIIIDHLTNKLSLGQKLSPKEQHILDAVSSPNLRSDQCISDALELYLKLHKNPSDNLEYDSRRAVTLFVEASGDIPLVNLRRAMLNHYVQKRIEDGLRTTSIRRELSSLSAIVSFAAREWELNIANSFQRIAIPKEGSDKKPQPKLTQQNWVDLFSKCNTSRITDLVPRMLWATGMRISELAGLKLDEVILDPETDPVTGERIPHILIQPNEVRGLKNKTSKRIVPLVGVSLEAFQSAYNIAVDGGDVYLLPDYAVEGGGDSLGAAVNKRIKPFGGPHSHTFRHHLTDRLRLHGVSNELGGSITGHAERGSEYSSYGFGFALQSKRDALLKVCALPTIKGAK